MKRRAPVLPTGVTSAFSSERGPMTADGMGKLFERLEAEATVALLYELSPMGVHRLTIMMENNNEERGRVAMVYTLNVL